MAEKVSRQEVAKAFAAHLPAMRRDFGLSQREIGTMLGKSRQAISLVERQLLPIPWDSVLALLFVFSQLDRKKLEESLAFLTDLGVKKPSAAFFMTL